MQTVRLLARKAGDTALWLIAGMHLLLVLALMAALLSVSQAHAEGAAPSTDIVCTGRNLLPDIKASDPAAFETIVKQAAETPNGKGIFWKIEKPGIPPSYLLGTMHVTDPRVLSMPQGATEAYQTAKTVIVESDEIVDDKKAAAAIMARPDLTMFTDGKSIADFLKPGEQGRLETGLKARGIPLTLVMKMKPWMIASFVALPACEISRKAAGASFLDKKLAEDALSSGKTLKGLETLVEQLKAMDDLPVAFHVQALIETLDLGKKIDDVMVTTTELYLSGDTGMIMPMMKAVSKEADSDDEDGYADFERRIITDRNKIMATRAAASLNEGAAFMAVGALHLPGKDGLIELLRKDGFTVTRLN